MTSPRSQARISWPATESVGNKGALNGRARHESCKGADSLTPPLALEAWLSTHRNRWTPAHTKHLRRTVAERWTRFVAEAGLQPYP